MYTKLYSRRSRHKEKRRRRKDWRYKAYSVCICSPFYRLHKGPVENGFLSLHRTEYFCPQWLGSQQHYTEETEIDTTKIDTTNDDDLQFLGNS